MLNALYLIGLTLFITEEISTLRTLFSISLGLAMNVFAREEQKVKSSTLNIDKTLAGELVVKIEQFLKENRPYLNSDFRIQNLSIAIDSNPTYTSNVINQCMNTTYSDLINKFRIAKAKSQLISKSENKKIFAIALDSGFNNKTNFIRVFKKMVGESPTEYRKKYEVSGDIS